MCLQAATSPATVAYQNKLGMAYANELWLDWLGMLGGAPTARVLSAAQRGFSQCLPSRVVPQRICDMLIVYRAMVGPSNLQRDVASSMCSCRSCSARVVCEVCVRRLGVWNR